jgi:hypothetical protein
MAECFWPDVREASVERTAHRIGQSAAELARAGSCVALTSPIVRPGDEVVLYLFTGPAKAVREVCELAQVAFERVIEAIELRQPADV